MDKSCTVLVLLVSSLQEYLFSNCLDIPSSVIDDLDVLKVTNISEKFDNFPSDSRIEE